MGSDDSIPEETIDQPKHLVPEPMCLTESQVPAPTPDQSVSVTASQPGHISTLPSTNPSSEQVNLAPPGYLLMQELGKGGMGVVYLATHIRLKRTVALKMMLAASGQNLDRFRFEAEAMARVRHPHVAQVYDGGEFAGQPFLAMEHLSGDTLAAKIHRDQPMPLRESVSLMIKIARGVGAAHRQGIIHRDLKPANVLFDANGEPKVTDFGLAKVGDIQEKRVKTSTTQVPSREDLTSAGDVMGTPAYMSPEQAKGETHTAGPAADVYSLGVILFELLTGERPFTASKVKELVQKVISEPAPPLRTPTRRFPRDIHAITMKSLAKDPAERYLDANEFADDLERYQQHQIVQARPNIGWEKIPKWIRRHPAITAILGVATSALLIILVGGSILMNRIIVQRDRAVLAEKVEKALSSELSSSLLATEEARQAAMQAKADEEEKSKELAKALDQSQQNLAASKVVQTQAIWNNDGTTLQCQELLNSVPELHRNIEWNLLRNQLDGALFAMYGHTAAITAIAVSLDGTKILTGSLDRTARIWDAQTGTILQTFKEHHSTVTCVAFSPDGQHVATGTAEHKVHLWETKHGLQIHEFKGHTGEATGVVFSPDGRQLITSSSDGSVRVSEVATGNLVRIIKGNSKEISCLALSPNGEEITTGLLDSMAIIWNLSTGKKRAELRGHEANVRGVAYSPDGQFLVTVDDSNVIRLWKQTDGTLIRKLPISAGDISSVVVSPDSQFIAVKSSGVGGFGRSIGYEDHVIRVFDIHTFKPRYVFKGHTGAVQALAFSRDGQFLYSAAADATVRVWDMTTGRNFLEFPNHPEGVHAIANSPNSKRLAVGTGNGEIRLVDSVTGTILKRLRGHSAQVKSVAFSSDSLQIISAGDTTIRIWDASTGELKRVLKGHADLVQQVIISPDGKKLASRGVVDGVKVWNLATGQVERTFQDTDGSIDSLAFSPDSQQIAIANSDNQEIQICDVNTGKLINRLIGHQKAITSIAYDATGKYLASGSLDETTRIWDLTTGERIGLLKGLGEEIKQVVWNQEASRLITLTDRGFRIWDVNTEQSLYAYALPEGLLNCLCLSTDGNRLFGGTFGEHQLISWNLEVEPHPRRLYGAIENAETAMLSPDGKLVATRNGRSVRIWDATTGKYIRGLREFAMLHSGLAFSLDSTRIITSGTNEKYVWDVKNGQRILSDITPEEAPPNYRTFLNQYVFTFTAGRVFLVPRDLFEVPPIEQDRRRLFQQQDLRWHLRRADELERNQQLSAAKLHRIWDHENRFRIALAQFDFDQAWGHAIAAKVLRSAK